MNKKSFYIVLTCLSFIVLGLIVRSVWVKEKEEEPQEENQTREFVEISEEEAKSHGITVLKAGPTLLSQNCSLRGKVVLEPQHRGVILAQVSGVVKEALKNRGESVKKGEVVAVIESREVAEAKAAFLAALQREKYLSSLFEGEEKLYEKKIASTQEYLQILHDFEEAKINLQLAKQKLYTLGFGADEITESLNDNEKNFRLYEVKSPRSGILASRFVASGEYVAEATPLFEVVDLRKASIEIGVYPQDLGKVRIGQEVEIVSLQDDHKSVGKVVYLSPFIEEATMSCKGIVELDNKSGVFRPGSFVNVSLQDPSSKSVVAVAKEGVQMIEGAPCVFVKTPEGFLKQEIVTGVEDARFVEVVSGIEEGVEYAGGLTFLLKADLAKDSLEHED